MLTLFKQIFTWWNHQTLGTRLHTFFNDERPGIIFPSGRLSKLTLFGLWDREWEKTPIVLAKKNNFPLND